ncbi:PREDICTED: uncharacterized protein LOC109154734 [Ipomoea nil]|uniref:uncharacterized protein LOC109154734 n=1 Tax=Ipomoea nil TaxID=35883 RepID=UPI000901061D|nr:PREDICTED: uncharacterized protein LOC109154734 [Ipomoea nil]
MNERGQWDEEILNDLFEEADVRRIVATPIATHLPDSWRWVGDIRGAYSVKHGYKILTADYALHTPGEFVVWEKIWGLQVPPKVRNLIWRCTRGILPVRENLKSKSVWIGDRYPLCGQHVETAEHLLGDCWIARQIWKKDDVLQGASIQAFIETVLSSSCGERVVHMAAVFWMLWTMRNDRVWRNKMWGIAVIHNHILGLISTWNDAYKLAASRACMADVCVIWEPPPWHWLKCNVDAAILADNVGFGATIRDHGGRFVAAKNGRLVCNWDPLMAEACAVKEALFWLRDSIVKQCLLIASESSQEISESSPLGTLLFAMSRDQRIE